MTPARRTVLQLAAIVAVGVGTFGAAWWQGRPSSGELVTVQDLPADVEAEVAAVWSEFVDRFDARMTCVPDVELELVGDVPGGDARYLVADRRIEIAIPTTPARFRESLAHELAHHVEHACPAFADLRRDLQSMLGSDVSWSAGPTWEETPSEMWAEAVVELVNGTRVRHADEIAVEPEVLDAIVRWGS